MPEKPLTIATYAAGVSLAAITLIYVFGPTYLINGASSAYASQNHKKGIVGLSNPANDCFINSVLQCLAGLGDLRIYLIRETHRRGQDGSAIYDIYEDEKPIGKNLDRVKLEGLQKGIVTQALKEVLDSLNERPIYRKTVSAGAFVADLERAFQQRISRRQQDAQEFLQVVAERLRDEHHAVQKARRKARAQAANLETEDDAARSSCSMDNKGMSDDRMTDDKDLFVQENGFPLEGTLESQIECLSCRFKPKPSVSTFVTLTLHVPQQSSTTLNSCFDVLLKTEYIDDFKCEKCRLEHAVEAEIQKLTKALPGHDKDQIQERIDKLKQAIQNDPETPPRDVTLPDLSQAPKRRIARHVRITFFPKVIAIHLSRSIYDPGSASMKNSAKVSFPERLSLGGILDRKEYKLLGLVTHKGNHNSGHYESFRRQFAYPPYSTPNAFQASSSSSFSAASGKVSCATPVTSVVSSPRISSAAAVSPSIVKDTSTLASTPPASPRPSSTSVDERPSIVVASPRSSESRATSTDQTSMLSTTTATTTGSRRSLPTSTMPDAHRSKQRKRKQQQQQQQYEHKRRLNNGDRWWRISDDKFKEIKTSDVLATQQREVYLLFYELDKNRDIERGDSEGLL